MKIVALLALLRAGAASAAVSAPLPGDPGAPAKRKAEWIEVTPAPIPAGLPLLRTPRAPAALTAAPAVDRPALRSLLVNGRFVRLTQVIEDFQAAFEKDPSREEWMHDAYDVLGYAHERERALLERWIVATPRSFAPYLARAAYWVRSGFLWRGDEAVRETSRFELDAMRGAFERARVDLRKALALRPGLIEARALLIQLEVAGGDRAVARRELEAALARCPTCFHVRRTWLWALEPRWGGSFEEMAAFVARADPRAPRQRLLAGDLLLEGARAAAEAGSRPLQRDLLDKACAAGGDWQAFVARADARSSDDPDASLADLERASALQPGLSDILARRAAALVRANRWEEAGRDLLVVLRSRPSSLTGVWLHPQVALALDTLAWKEHLAHHERTAARVYALAVALAPADAAVVQRAREVLQAARAAGAPAQGEREAPLVGELRPDVRIAVVDREGRPVPGALVVVEQGRGDAEHLAGMMDAAAASPRRADAEGRVVVPAGVGPWIAAAFLPRVPLLGVVATVAVETTGADLRLAIAGSERIRGSAFRQTTGPGSPGLPGAHVRVVPLLGAAPEPRALAEATADANGRFVIEGVDPIRYSTFAEARDATGIALRAPPGEVTGGRELYVTLGEQRVLRGRVLVTGPDGAATPATRFQVTASAAMREVSTSDGRFSMELPQQATVRLEVTISVQGRPPVVRVLEKPVVDNDLGDVVVGPGRTVRGRVLDPLGAPVDKAPVIFRPTRRLLAWTGADGSFEVTAPDGVYPLEVDHPRWVRQERDVAADETRLEVRLRDGAVLRVVVDDRAGAPVSGVSLQLTPLANRPSRGCLTEANGRCEIAGLEPGSYQLTAFRPRQEPNAIPPSPMAFPIPRAGELSLRFPWGAERGWVTIDATQRGPSPAPRGGRLFPGERTYAEAMNDKGEPLLPHFELAAGRGTSVPAGRYTVIAVGPGPECGIRAVDVRPGKNTPIAVELAAAGCR